MTDQSFRAFVAAIEAGDDLEAERQSHLLTETSEMDLLDLANSENIDKQWWAVRALANCGTEQATSTLATMLEKEDNALRAAGALALGHLYRRAPNAVSHTLEKVAGLLSDEDGLVRQTAADALAMCGDAALPALRAVLESSHQGARARAAHTLRKIATKAMVPLLFQHLNDENYLVRMHAYEALDEMGLLDNVLVTL